MIPWLLAGVVGVVLNQDVGLHAQYAIPSWTVAGGGVSSGAGFRVQGSVGQADAGPLMTGGDYAVVGGYWAAGTVEQGPAPTLSIERGAPSEVRISWSPDSSAWVLQENVSLSPSGWTIVSGATENPMVISAGKSAKFYRLIRSSQ